MTKKIITTTGLRVFKSAGRVTSAKINIADNYYELINAAFQPLIDYKKNKSASRPASSELEPRHR